MSFAKKPALAENVPVWVREKRQPTRAELAAKHDADGGGMAPPASNSYAFFGGEIKVKRYNS